MQMPTRSRVGADSYMRKRYQPTGPDAMSAGAGGHGDRASLGDGCAQGPDRGAAGGAAPSLPTVKDLSLRPTP